MSQYVVKVLFYIFGSVTGIRLIINEVVVDTNNVLKDLTAAHLHYREVNNILVSFFIII